MTDTAHPNCSPADREDLRRALEGVRDRALSLVSRLPASPSRLVVAAGDVSIELAWAPPVPAVAPGERLLTGPSAEAGEVRRQLRAPTVGYFATGPRPGTDPFVRAGDRVVPGQQVAVIRLLDLDVPVTADGTGVVVEVLRKDGDPVEHDEPLFLVELGAPDAIA